jgi:hypothetical protein
MTEGIGLGCAMVWLTIAMSDVTFLEPKDGGAGRNRNRVPC